MGNKELAQLWKWADQNPNALTDPQRVQTPSDMDYWKPFAEDMDASAGIEPEFHHKNNRVYCWKGLRFSARQDLEGFSRFTDHGIEGVIPPELLPADVRLKLHARPSEKAKRAKKEEESKGPQTQPDDSQVAAATAAETDGGSSAEQEDGAIPMDSDAGGVAISHGGGMTPEEGQKQSPEMDMGQDAEQSEAEEGEAEAKGEVQVEADIGGT